MRLPGTLEAFGQHRGRPLVKVLLDLTIYLKGPTLPEFEWLVSYYGNLCPSSRLKRFKIAELVQWSDVANPVLTDSARVAAAAGIERPYFEPTRMRIRDGRAFEAQYWDQRDIEDPSGTWSLNIQGVKLRASGLHSFVRFLFPLDTDLRLIATTASDVANSIDFYSGHGGLAFVYDVAWKGKAFGEIYAKAKRYWGIDIEDLNLTLPHMRTRLKSPNWLFMIGSAQADDVRGRLQAADPQTSPVRIVTRRFGDVLLLGNRPDPIDANRPPRLSEAYRAVASAISPLLVQDIGSFVSENFDEVSTNAWFARFNQDEPWRFA